MTSRRATLQMAVAAALAPRAVLAQPAPVIAAASDLADALPLVIAAYQKRTGKTVRVLYGPSAGFARQIQGGETRFEVFMASDEAYVDQLQKAGLTANSGALYGIGRLCLFVPKASKVRLDARLRDLAAAAEDGRLQKLALFTTNGPYGRASRDALTQAKVWMPLQPKVALVETSTQMAQVVTSGGVQAALLPLSIAVVPKVQGAGTYVLVPETAHKPMRQRAVVLKGASAGAEMFYRFLRDPEARAILKTHGFRLPGGR
ncbi:molybdate ABC transporter substrate-binding protein [Phenylobacterium sp. J367]|uniref:molybdate ABC transporter substrate-binding protein n=1 Tax=Phenylobacterium sp. J367 TaxID=2898435 RepID=UPI002150FA17|nr:molybdate ABC transporter substrate-binding protein [Phenylobacterium sp. J367]MCR5880965.1 molybdate ABC transporter substrate-binding protein [Phenylobacterium sp. J367]